MNEHDPVDHPSHYTQGAIECIDAIEAALGEEGFIAFLRGQIMKYTWRLGLKGAAEEDAGKIAWYADRLEHVLAGRACAPQDEECIRIEVPRDWRPITAEEVKRARDQFRVQYNSVTFKDGVRPRYATRVYDLDGNMRLTYPPFEFNWDAVTEGNDWVARDPATGDVYSYENKPEYRQAIGEFLLGAGAYYERNLRDALPDGVFLIERVRLDDHDGRGRADG